MVDVLAIRVTTVVAPVVLGQLLPARACRGALTGTLACTHESGGGSAPHAARVVTAAWHGYEQSARRCRFPRMQERGDGQFTAAVPGKR
jgi:hypothetical protein